MVGDAPLGVPPIEHKTNKYKINNPTIALSPKQVLLLFVYINATVTDTVGTPRAPSPTLTSLSTLHTAFITPKSYILNPNPCYLVSCCQRADWRWQMAMARASAASSGCGVSSSLRVIRTICWICFLSALP